MSSQDNSKNLNYQREMAQTIAELDPNFATTSNHIFPVNPIAGLDLSDVLGTRNESNEESELDSVFDFDDIPNWGIDVRDHDDYQNENDDIVQVGDGATRKKTKPLFTIKKSTEHFYQKFQMMGTYYSLDIAEPDPKMAPEKWVRLLLESVITHFKNNSSITVKSGDKIGLTLKNNVCMSEPIYVSLRRADQLDADVVLEHVFHIFDSNKEFFLNGHLYIQFDHIQLPHGSGRLTRQFGQTNADFILNKACYLQYKNPFMAYPEDDHCLPYALVIARAYIQAENGEIRRRGYENYQKTFKTLRLAAEKLCKEAGVKLSQLRGGCSIDEVKMFQRVLTTYQIIIYTPNTKKPIHVDKWYNGKNKINIMLHDNHYSAMRSVTACFGARYICEDCHTHTDTKALHFCKYACTQCQSTPKCDTLEKTISCSDCNRFFFGQICYSNHLKMSKENRSVCTQKKNCSKCKTFAEKDHQCGKRKCFTCEKIVSKDVNHLCHIPVYESKMIDGIKILYVMFDLETQQDTQLSFVEPNKFKHVVNLCVAHSVCTNCLEISDISIPCAECGIREHIYYSKMCIEDFLNFIVDKQKETEMRDDVFTGQPKKCPKFDKIVIIAHNFSGFDGQFILKYIYESDRFKNPSIIMNGTRVTDISIGSRIKFIDSLNYFQVALSDLPKLCGFEGSKGHYPFLMNTDSMINYIGAKPAKSFYGYDSMKSNARDVFDDWYDNLPSDYIFNNSKELLEYCIQDVTILRKACVKFLTDFYKSNGIDPFVEASTIAAACSKVYRSKYMKPDTIGIIPTKGYRLVDTQSKFALKYLCSVEMEHNIKIQHAGRGREFIIPGVGRVDGLYRGTIDGINSNGKDTVWEMDGCHWHSCTSCNPSYYDDEDNPMFTEFRRRRDCTLAKHNAITDAGYNLIVKRECDFRRELQSRPVLLAKLNSHPSLASEPLNPRDAFYGGRTDANILYFKADEETKMHFFDICSMYPFLNKISKYCVNHPKVHVGDDCLTIPWQNIHGLMKVTVSPPRGLHFPVLPLRLHKKLMFVLCKTCAETLNQSLCEHSENDRQFTATYVIEEVRLAVAKGYEIVKIHEIWEYEVEQYDPVTKTGGLFANFINNFLKLKTESSGYPEWCVTPEQKKSFIDSFYEREGVLLEDSKMEYNPGLRLMSKIMLNSFWGRFGMRPDLLRTKVIHSGEELRDIIFNVNLDVHSVIPINDDHMIVNYREHEEVRAPNKTTNIVIAAFTTSYARLELYKYLDMLGGERVAYYDTDSVQFTAKPGEVMPELGDFLGQMTDELAKHGKGTTISESVNGGPKNYAYKTFSPTTNITRTFVKVKGITLNYENSQVVNFDLIKSYVTDPDKADSKVKVTTNSIRRTNTADVYSTRVLKTYSVKYNKRQKTGSNYTTIPYGY